MRLGPVILSDLAHPRAAHVTLLNRTSHKRDARLQEVHVKKLAAPVIEGLLAVLWMGPIGASSHREAPLSSQDPLADNTDVDSRGGGQEKYSDRFVRSRGSATRS
jgi:hypothetical protein